MNIIISLKETQTPLFKYINPFWFSSDKSIYLSQDTDKSTTINVKEASTELLLDIYNGMLNNELTIDNPSVLVKEISLRINKSIKIEEQSNNQKQTVEVQAITNKEQEEDKLIEEQAQNIAKMPLSRMTMQFVLPESKDDLSVADTTESERKLLKLATKVLEIETSKQQPRKAVIKFLEDKIKELSEHIAEVSEDSFLSAVKDEDEKLLIKTKDNRLQEIEITH